MDKRYVLGIDIGIASVGWAIVEVEQQEIIESGVRLFSSADAANNISRRNFRGIKRNKRRQRNRLERVNSFLEEKGFNRPCSINYNPLVLRVKGLTEQLEREEIYVSLYNIAKHRGVSYLEDLEEAKGSDSVFKNMRHEKFVYPCQIQLERYEKYGAYRGTIVADNETFINTFTVAMYEKEVRKILQVQAQYYEIIDEQFIEAYLLILKSKREYYIGPGNELSRTNYGVYKTSGETKDNLFDELRGKCSVYNGKNGMEAKSRASGASYSVQYYNLLNDLCNIKVDGEKLSKKQKEEIIELMKNNNTSMKITAALKKLYKIDANLVSGYRIDKNKKEENHSFSTYRAMKKWLETFHFNIEDYSIETLDAIADILTLNTETKGIEDYFNNGDRPEYVNIKGLSPEEVQVFIDFRRKNGSLFSKWSSFSYFLIKQVVPEMLESGDEQHTCIHRMGIKKYEKSNQTRLEINDIVDEIYNPVVSRSIRQTIRIVNELSKKYNLADIVIEMPRDKNSDDERQNIMKMQKNNEELRKNALVYAGVTEEEVAQCLDKKILQKLKLYYKQQGRCLYSGKIIDVSKLINGSFDYEIDHIIPISISFDDSQSNKVLVASDQNQKKSNMTPFQYLSKTSNVWSYPEYKSYVLGIRKDNFINERQKDNLLFEKDITKEEVLKGFISRNINDTRYASRVVLNELTKFYNADGRKTKIRVINGAMTSQFRKTTLDLKKDRNEDYRHHAQDAMICCYTALSLNKYNEEFLNVETGEVINKEKLQLLNKEEKAAYLSYTGWDIKNKILGFNEQIKFSHKVDTKVNRGLSDQTIYGTREYNGELYVINKIKDIYDDKEYDKFKKKMEKDSSQFLMYEHDPKTWEKLLKVITMYPDVKGSPFKKYREEFGEITKFAKKNDGPPIKVLKYRDHKVGKGIDISHKYEGVKNKVLLESLTPFRADIYYDNQKKCYNMVPIIMSDFKFEAGKYILPKEKYIELLRKEKLIDLTETIEDVEKKGHEFRFSLYRNSILEIRDDEESQQYRFWAKNHSSKNYFEVKGIDLELEKQKHIGLTKKITECIKYNVDILGNMHKVVKEELKLEFQLDNQMI